MTSPPIPALCPSRVPRQSAADTLVSALAAGVDHSLMRAVSLVVEKRLLPGEVDLQSLRESVAAMLETGLATRPADLFRFVRRIEGSALPARVRTRALTGRRPPGGRVYRRALASDHRPHPAVPAARGARPDDTILFEHWVHESEPARGTVILVHGFAMGWPLIDGLALSAAQWYGRGLDVALLTLPDHGRRRPRGSLVSGQRYTVPHALHLAGAVRQAVHEIFELKQWLRGRSSGPVGLFGMSLGGYLASLCAGLSADFDFLVPAVPPACMGDLAWRVYRQTAHHRGGPDTLLTEANLRAAFRAHSPLAHALKVDRERVLIVAGAGDRIVPPEHPSALWEHWDRPAIHWFRGSHVAPVTGAGLMRVLDAHLASLGITAP